MVNSAALRRSLSDGAKIDQGMLRYVLDQSRDCIKILGPEGKVNYVNSEGRCALEITDLATILGKFWPDLWPAYSRPLVCKALEQAFAGDSNEFEAVRPDSKGNQRWWRISVSPLKEQSGELAGILTISQDVTDHVRVRESEQTLALEMRHRLRNAYTVSSAIVMQSARGDASVQGFAERVAARLADVALSQTRLLEAGKKSWLLSDLVEMLVEAHGAGAAAIRYAGSADSSVDGHEAMLVALVIGELTNNSLKYGALGHMRPASLSWVVHEGELTLHWREPLINGEDEPMQPRDPASGYSMMERMARAQHATFEHKVDDGELKVTLRLAKSR